MDIQKKVAIISGAFGYVGFEISKQLARDGMSIAMLYRGDSEETVKNKLNDLNGEGHRAYQCDLKDAQEVEKSIEMIEEEMGPLCVCVHAAGQKPKRKTLLLSSVEDFNDQFKDNIIPSFNFISSCSKKLKEHGKGVVVGITTVGVISPKATRSLGAYIPAKYALQGILVMLKEELAQASVRVYSVAPGFLPGGMNEDIPRAFIEIMKQKSLTKKLTDVTDVAKKVSYLCSDEASKEKELTFIVDESGLS